MVRMKSKKRKRKHEKLKLVISLRPSYLKMHYWNLHMWLKKKKEKDKGIVIVSLYLRFLYY